MRIDQIVTLVWTGNVLLLGGTGWLGWSFLEQKRGQAAAEGVPWPDGAAAKPLAPRWPGPVTNFRHVWETPLSGAVPPPPEPARREPEKVDPATAFRNRVQLVGGMPASAPEKRMLLVTDNGVPRFLRCGQRLDDWKLSDVRVDLREGVCSGVFHNPAYERDEGYLTITQSVPPVERPGRSDEPPFVRSFPRDGVVHEGPAPRETVEAQAWRDRGTGEWIVPPEEVAWWEAWGLPDVVEKTKFVERPQGVEVASPPPRGPLDSTRGLVQGDVIVSVNGRPVASMAAILAYLRGEGRGETRFEVVVERDGKRRTQVYNLRRRS